MWGFNGRGLCVCRLEMPGDGLPFASTPVPSRPPMTQPLALALSIGADVRRLLRRRTARDGQHSEWVGAPAYVDLRCRATGLPFASTPVPSRPPVTQPLTPATDTGTEPPRRVPPRPDGMFCP